MNSTVTFAQGFDKISEGVKINFKTDDEENVELVAHVLRGCASDMILGIDAIEALNVKISFTNGRCLASFRGRRK